MVQPTDFNRFVKDVIARFKPNLAMRQQCLIEDIQETIPLAEIDAPRLEQVIINLLSNASKFSQDQGTIAIRASIDSNHLQVDVRDCGIGITSESQKRVFEPYHKAEQDRQPFTGLGLGLAISKKIIEAHGGKIWLFSIPGQGSTFSFSIPIGLR
jgi:signal transduction histidine kinase